MSRSKRFFAGLLSSYAAIGVNILYTITSIPLALHYLDQDEFGLWALVTQLSGYLMLLEFGMSGSVARSLSDHKDTVEAGIYGSILRTGGWVFAIQGLLVTIAGLALAIFAPPLLGLPTHLNRTFTNLMAVQALMTGIKLSLSILGAPLWCHQRLDITNMINGVSLILSFAVLWVSFHAGIHVYSIVVASFAGYLFSIIAVSYSCKKNGYYPSAEHRGAYCPRIFRELFHFGGGLFLMNLGAQLASASQVIICSRLLGIEAAAIWSIATKIFGMAQQFVSRVLDSSAGGLAEMVVRKEHALLHKRFRDLVSITALMAVAASAGIALMNGPFIEIWTSGKITWNPWNNLLLAGVLFSNAITRCHTSLVGITKQIRGMKFVYLLEGISFVSLAMLLVPWIGLAGLLCAALLCNTVITGSYSIARTSHYFGITWLRAMSWVARPVGILILIVLIFAFTRLPLLAGLPTTTRFCINFGLLTILVGPAIWLLGLTPSLRIDIHILISKISGKFKFSP